MRQLLMVSFTWITNASELAESNTLLVKAFGQNCSSYRSEMGYGLGRMSKGVFWRWNDAGFWCQVWWVFYTY